jgi:hypothetical protein
MKKFHTLKGLFEQEAADAPKIKIKITGTTTSPDERTAIKWSYQYGWPLTQPNLGSIQEFTKAFAASTEKDAETVKNAILNSDQGGVVGVTRDPGNTVNKRLFGKDLAEAVGFIYLLNPDIINEKSVPANKQLAKIAERFTFIVDKDIENYLAADGQDDDEIPSNNRNALSTDDNDGTSTIKAASFLQKDGDAYSWYNEGVNIIGTYINPIQGKIGSSEIIMNQSAPIVSIFWTFISKLPGGLSTPMPSGLASTTFDGGLQDAIKILLAKSDEYDGNYAPDTVDTTKLNRNLFATLVEALIVIGLNNSITAANVENEVLPASYKAPLANALEAAKGITGSSSTAGSSTGSASASATTGTFDGASVNDEMELAKIISGGLIGYSVPAADVDTVDKVKAKWNSYVPATYSKTFEEIVAKLPFNSTTDTKLAEFKNIQYFTIQKTDPNGLPYGPKTKAGFKAAFEKSSIK